MKVFKEERPGRGYEFPKNVHSQNALKVFNVILPHLSDAPEDANLFELMAYPLFVACAWYGQTTDVAGATDFEKGLRIAIWAHSMRTGSTDEEAKEITEDVFRYMARIGLLKAQGAGFAESLESDPSEETLNWLSTAIHRAEGAVKALTTRV